MTGTSAKKRAPAFLSLFLAVRRNYFNFPLSHLYENYPMTNIKLEKPLCVKIGHFRQLWILSDVDSYSMTSVTGRTLRSRVLRLPNHCEIQMNACGHALHGTGASFLVKTLQQVQRRYRCNRMQEERKTMIVRQTQAGIWSLHTGNTATDWLPSENLLLLAHLIISW